MSMVDKRWATSHSPESVWCIQFRKVSYFSERLLALYSDLFAMKPFLFFFSPENQLGLSGRFLNVDTLRLEKRKLRLAGTLNVL